MTLRARKDRTVCINGGCAQARVARVTSKCRIREEFAHEARSLAVIITVAEGRAITDVAGRAVRRFICAQG